MIRVGSIVIRVDDLERQKAFWTAALDYVPRGRRDDDDFALLRPRDGDGPNVSLDRVRSTVQIPPRIHLDLYAEDQAAEVQRLIGLGATEVHWDKRPAGRRLRDPRRPRGQPLLRDRHHALTPAPAVTASPWPTACSRRAGRCRRCRGRGR